MALLKQQAGVRNEASKGMGEVTMIAIVPAIVNAIAHATGHRSRELPVTATKIREAFA